MEADTIFVRGSLIDPFLTGVEKSAWVSGQGKVAWADAEWGGS